MPRAAFCLRMQREKIYGSGGYDSRRPGTTPSGQPVVRESPSADCKRETYPDAAVRPVNHAPYRHGARRTAAPETAHGTSRLFRRRGVQPRRRRRRSGRKRTATAVLLRNSDPFHGLFPFRVQRMGLIGRFPEVDPCNDPAVVRGTSASGRYSRCPSSRSPMTRYF